MRPTRDLRERALRNVASGLVCLLVALVPSSASVLRNIGSLDTPRLARDVEVAGDLAYVVDYGGGLRVTPIAIRRDDGLEREPRTQPDFTLTAFLRPAPWWLFWLSARNGEQGVDTSPATVPDGNV